jgi:nucleotide-binding universal stress UspA family protein
MYKNVMVALDNSEWSNHAMKLAVELASTTGAKLTGNHVYAARLHGDRFNQLEPGLPAHFQQEEALERLRGVHGVLIGRGLEIISNSYLDLFEQRCREAGIEWARKALEGRHYAELVRDARESGYDLVVLGAHGLGRVDRSVLGSVCERVSRLVECDLLVAHDDRSIASGELLVAIDGSAHSFAALKVALQLSRRFGSPVTAVAAYDPFFHGAAFSNIAGVLSQEASRLFRFKEQEKLHDEIIDTGLEGVYGAHLKRAKGVAEQQGVALKTEILEGKPFDAVAAYVEKRRPVLLLVGRIGIHHSEGVTLGSTAENLLRVAGCNVMVVHSAPSRSPQR